MHKGGKALSEREEAKGEREGGDSLGKRREGEGRSEGERCI